MLYTNSFYNVFQGVLCRLSIYHCTLSTIVIIKDTKIVCCVYAKTIDVVTTLSSRYRADMYTRFYVIFKKQEELDSRSMTGFSHDWCGSGIVSEMKEVKTDIQKLSEDDYSATLSKLLHIAEQFYLNLRETKRLEDSTEDWKLVAMVLDRMFLIIFIFLGVVLSFVILARNGPYDEEFDFSKAV